MLTRECDLKIVSLDPCGFIDGLACIVKLFVVSSMRHLPSTLMKEALCVCVYSTATDWPRTRPEFVCRDPVPFGFTALPIVYQSQISLELVLNAGEAAVGCESQ